MDPPPPANSKGSKHVLRPSDSSRTLASFTSSKHEEAEEKDMSASTLTLVDAATQTYWTSSAGTQTQWENINLQEKAVEVQRQASTRSQAGVKKVPVSERHGLLGKICLLYEAEDPKAYPHKIKWFITLTVALAAAAAPLGSSILLRKCPMYLRTC